MRIQGVLRLPRVSGISADAAITTLAFLSTAAPTLAQLQALRVAVQRFFRTPVAPATQALATYLSNDLALASASLKFYDIDGGVNAPPLASLGCDLTIARAQATDIPEEAAVALSYRAALEENTLDARRKGRMFFGPLNAGAVVSDVDRTRVNGVLRDCYAAAGPRFITEVAAVGAGLQWGVWSRADDVIRPVVAGWCDDAFDVIRSRGPKPAGRTSWLAA